MEFLLLNNAISLVYTWQVDFRLEFNCWWLFWVVLISDDFKHEDSHVKVCVWWSDDGSIPLSKVFVVTIGETIRNTLVTELGMLGFLELFPESEGSWHYRFRMELDLVHIVKLKSSLLHRAETSF
mgnify:CR=1 FL=1